MNRKTFSISIPKVKIPKPLGSGTPKATPRPDHTDPQALPAEPAQQHDAPLHWPSAPSLIVEAKGQGPLHLGRRPMNARQHTLDRSTTDDTPDSHPSDSSGDAVLPDTPRFTATRSANSGAARSTRIGLRAEPSPIGTHPLYPTPIFAPQVHEPDTQDPVHGIGDEPQSPRRAARGALPVQAQATQHSPARPPDAREAELPHHRSVRPQQPITGAARQRKLKSLVSRLHTLRNAGTTLADDELAPALTLCQDQRLSVRDRHALFEASVAMLPPLPEGESAHQMCLSWIASLDDEQAQAPWLTLYGQRPDPLPGPQPASEETQVSLLPPDDWIF